MAEKLLPPKKRWLFTSSPSAGSSAGDGGGGGDSAAAPAPAPRREPSSSSPPKPFTSNPGAGSSGGGGLEGREPSYSPPSLSWSSFSDEDSDDEKRDEFQTRNRCDALFMSDNQVLSSYSSDPQNPPQYIGRQNGEPLTTQKFFSLHHNWEQLLDGKKTYLRPPKNNRVAKTNYVDHVFVTPKPLEAALRCQEPLSHLVHGAAGKPITRQKFKILSEHYVCFRSMRRDGSQFYRAFLFSYLENLGKMQGSQAEVTRLMECVASSRVHFRRLKWINAYFSDPLAFFSSVVSEFEHLVSSVANGLNADELYKISLQEISSSRKVHIRTYEADYNRELRQNQIEKINALLFCEEYVRPFDADVNLLQMKALSQALGIPLHLAAVGVTLNDGTVQVECQVECLDFIPRSGPLSSIRKYYLSSAADEHPVLPDENLFSSVCMPLVTLLITRNGFAILYRK